MKTKDGKVFSVHGTYYFFDQKEEEVIMVTKPSNLGNRAVHGTGDILISELYQSKDIAISEAQEYFKQKIQGYRERIEMLETRKSAGNR